MAVWLNNEDQRKAVEPAEVLDVVGKAIGQLAQGNAIRRPRIDNIIPTRRPDEFFVFSSMEGGVRDPGYYALRIKPDIFSFPEIDGIPRMVTYSVREGVYGGLVFLYSVDKAELLAIFNDGWISHLRVAATGTLGIRGLSRPDSRVLGVYGSGGMARVFPLFAAQVRPIERVQVWSPTREKLAEYVHEMEALMPCPVVPVASPELVAQDADIICSCTTSLQPVLKAEWLRPGTHVNNVTHWELGMDVRERVDTVGLLLRRNPMQIKDFKDDGYAGIRLNVMTYAAGKPSEIEKVPVGSPTPNRYPNAQLVDAINWETGDEYWHKRSDDEVTILANASYGTQEGEGGISAGIQGVQFASVAGAIYERAVKKGLGKELPAEMFLQDIPT